MTYRVAVVCRKKGFDNLRKKQGWWSYPVPEFSWQFVPVEDDQPVDKTKLAARFDLVFWEDWCFPEFVGKGAIPIYAAIVDSNTSPRRRKSYIERGRQADILLIDQDKLTPFRELGKPLYRWQYAVNEHVFSPLSKSVDAAYHVVPTPARGALTEPIRTHCQKHGLSLTAGSNLTTEQLAARYGAAKVVIHKATYKQCRSHRFFDVPAAGACLLTDRVWAVDGDGFKPGIHFAEWDNEAQLLEQITDLVGSGRWKAIADAGQAHVLTHHTWAVRARELKGIIDANQR